LQIRTAGETALNPKLLKLPIIKGSKFEENEPDAGIRAQIRARYRLSLEFERKGRFHALLEAVKAVLKR
jgi:hypothetical protein